MTCPTCGGEGTIYSSNGFMQTIKTCPTCGGTGFIIENHAKHVKDMALNLIFLKQIF